ncbi:MAG: hypothetical protein ACLFUJ_15035 [Phycisphaerae bacterium]
MQPAQKHTADLADLVQMEDDLAALLQDMAYDVEHTEQFDREQRAELHTILRALQADTEMHRGIIAVIARNGEYVKDV